NLAQFSTGSRIWAAGRSRGIAIRTAAERLRDWRSLLMTVLAYSDTPGHLLLPRGCSSCYRVSPSGVGGERDEVTRREQAFERGAAAFVRCAAPTPARLGFSRSPRAA